MSLSTNHTSTGGTHPHTTGHPGPAEPDDQSDNPEPRPQYVTTTTDAAAAQPCARRPPASADNCATTRYVRFARAASRCATAVDAMYHSLVTTDACPNNRAISVIDAPSSANRVANVCRNACTNAPRCTRSRTPAYR